jgi:hypothetical protein
LLGPANTTLDVRKHKRARNNDSARTNQQARKRFITDFLFDIEKGNCCTPISPAMQISIDSFGAVISDPASGLTLSAVQRMDKLPDEIVLADQVGLDVFLFRATHPCCL